MKRFTLAALFALAATVALADETTYTVKLKIGGISWAVSWGKAITASLEGLEGASKVSENKKDGTFEVVFKDSAKSSPSIVKAALPKKYTIDNFGLSIAGTLASGPEGKGLWVTTTAGQRIELVNRPAKDDKDKPADVEGDLRKALADGKTLARVEGTLTEDKDGNLKLELAKGEAAAPPSPEEKK